MWEEEPGERHSEEVNESESLIDCGLKLRKVSFMERWSRKSASCVSPGGRQLPGGGKPHHGGEGALILPRFLRCAMKRMKTGSGDEGADSRAAADGSGRTALSVRLRKRGRSLERADSKTKRDSWMDPPEEQETTTLTQAEMESCMQTYQVRRHPIFTTYIFTFFKFLFLVFLRKTISEFDLKNIYIIMLFKAALCNFFG